MNLSLRREAKTDLEDATFWYENNVAGLGDSFLDEVEAAFERMRAFPESYPIVHRDLRRCVLSRFPFCIFYSISDETIHIVAILHASRDPNDWTRA